MADDSTFRDGIKEIAPPWLDGDNGERLLYSLGATQDAVSEATQQAVKARLPSLAQEDALIFIGGDRLLLRGPTESAANFRLRLQLWLDSWMHAGSSYGLI